MKGCLTVIVLGILVIFLLVSTNACVTSSDEARSTAEKSGFSQIEAKGVSLFGCGEDDKWGRNFRAINPSGQIVGGTVCCGWAPFGIGKNCTIRF